MLPRSPSIWRIACLRCASVSALIRSPSPSTSVKPILPFKKALKQSNIKGNHHSQGKQSCYVHKLKGLMPSYFCLNNFLLLTSFNYADFTLHKITCKSYNLLAKSPGAAWCNPGNEPRASSMAVTTAVPPCTWNSAQSSPVKLAGPVNIKIRWVLLENIFSWDLLEVSWY